MADTKPKEYSYKIQVANIKLLSNSRKGDEAYSDIIHKIHSGKISVPVRGETHMILRTQFNDKVRIDDVDYDVIYGKISKYTVIDGNDWLNMNNMEVENIELPSNCFPNLRETEYIFIPNAHRFIIVRTPQISINTVAKFLSNAVKRVVNSDEDSQVFVEQSEDVFERIINAEAVRKLFIDISYSNADTGDEAYQLVDGLIRGSDVKRLKLDATPNQNESIRTDATLISGALRVAQSNGYAKATIIERGQKHIIDTKEHPLIIHFRSEETNLKKNIVERTMNIFRKNKNGN